MAKFKVNQKVSLVKNNYDVINNIGVVKAREVNHVGDKTEVKYLVDFGGGMENWLILSRKDLQSVENAEQTNNYLLKSYDAGDGKLITLAALVNKERDYVISDYGDVYKSYKKVLKIGFSIYNGTDTYDEKIGNKIAIHRCKKNPFTTMISPFSGEFNDDTVIAIMNQKANYIIDNFKEFYRPR